MQCPADKSGRQLVLQTARCILDQVVLWQGVSCDESGGGACDNRGSNAGNVVRGSVARSQTGQTQSMNIHYLHFPLYCLPDW